MRIDRRDVQVLFADLQPDLIAASATVPPRDLALAARRLARVAQALDLPMTFALVPEAGRPGQAIPELAAFARLDNMFHRVVADPFMGADFVAALAAHRRPLLLIAGFSAEVAVLQSALSAIDAGYRVYVAVDAIGSRSARTEGPALRDIERAGGVATSVFSFAARLAPDFSSPPGSHMVAAYRRTD